MALVAHVARVTYMVRKPRRLVCRMRKNQIGARRGRIDAGNYSRG